MEFSAAKSGDKTCSFDGKYLHSKYNPLQEGERFVSNLEADFSPFCVIILEPALSYCALPLRKRFPGAKICCVRFSNDFSEYDSKWDYVFYGAKENFLNLSEDLFNALGEENLISGLFFDWQASKNIFPELNAKCWKEIQKAVLKARDVLGTRSYFSKRWLKNSVLFCKNIQKGFTAGKTEKPVLIAASGPSLASSVPFIKKFRGCFFLIAVSSAFLPLLENGIEPDLTISSDGGFWAKRHFFVPGIKNYGHVFALEAEGASFSKIYEENEIVPLCYEDGLEQSLLKAVGCPFMISRRNGTVAGTALEFALEFTTQKVFLAGFDQAPASAFQHTQPNALEIISQKSDSRLSPKETRITKSRFGSEKSLEIYRNWFSANSARFEPRVSRISDNYNFPYALGKIKDINWTDFENLALGKPASSKSEIKKNPFRITLAKNERRERILSELKKISSSDFFLDEVFPMDSVLIRRGKNPEKKSALENKIKEKTRNLIEEISDLLK